MTEQFQDSWASFAVGQEESGWGIRGRRLLDSVFHVAHMRHALSIAYESRLRAGLVYDDSRLNTKRLLVSWLSPNTWADGSRYGNIGFEFDWRKLIQGRAFYWVGAMMEYRPPALRFLLARGPQDNLNLLPYDPTLGDGPWFYDSESDTHYWNDRFCLEFMVEHDMSLSEASGIVFENHHPKLCCLKTVPCPDKGLRVEEAGARFVAGFVAELKPQTPFPWLSNSAPTQGLRSAVNHLYFRLLPRRERERVNGTLNESDPVSVAIARAVLAAHYHDRREEVASLVGLFESFDTFFALCRHVIEKHLGLPEDSLAET